MKALSLYIIILFYCIDYGIEMQTPYCEAGNKCWILVGFAVSSFELKANFVVSSINVTEILIPIAHKLPIEICLLFISKKYFVGDVGPMSFFVFIFYTMELHGKKSTRDNILKWMFITFMLSNYCLSAAYSC